MTKVVLHIGPPKTGSTAIQTFLFDQRAELRRLGILYPRSGLRHRDSFGPRHKRLTHNGPRKPEYWTRAIEEIRTSRCDAAIISCEAFWAYEQHIPEIAARLRDFEVVVITALRRQDRLLASRYVHLVRHANYQLPPDALWAKLRPLMNFHTRMRLWTRWLPTRAILYPEHRHGLIERFLNAAGVDEPAIALASHLQAQYANQNASPIATDPNRVLGAVLAESIRHESFESNKALFADFFSVQGYTDALWE